MKYTNRRVCVSNSLIVSRLVGAEIKVGNNSDGTMNPVCATVTMEQTDAGQLIELNCTAEGRYISVELAGTTPLHFCEIKAYPCQGNFTFYLSLLILKAYLRQRGQSELRTKRN